MRGRAPVDVDEKASLVSSSTIKPLLRKKDRCEHQQSDASN